MSYRKIKFRGKDVFSGQWRYGAYIPIDFTQWREPSIFDGHHRAEVDGETLGQYTGYKDENENEIYEGDVLEITIDDRFKKELLLVIVHAIVRFGVHFGQMFQKTPKETCLGFYLEWTNGYPRKQYRKEFLYWVNNSKMRIIGNVYDNPELQEEMQ